MGKTVTCQATPRCIEIRSWGQVQVPIDFDKRVRSSPLLRELNQIEVLEFSGSRLEATRTLVVANPKESIEP